MNHDDSKMHKSGAVKKMAKNATHYDARQEMRSPDFEIQHKRDTYLTHVELHHHDFYEVYYLVSGDAAYVIEGKLTRIKPGDLLLVSPRELHKVSIESDEAPYERYVLWLSPAFVQSLSTPQTDLESGLNSSLPGYSNLLRLSPEQQITVRNLLESIFQEADSGSYGSDRMRISLVTQILVQINRLTRLRREEAETFVYSSRIVSDVVDYVNRHYREKLTLDGLAERFYVSKYHLSHEFQKHMGTGIYQYILKKRLQIARQLLAEGEPPTTVSGLCGFGDYPGFYRAFIAEYGTSPKTFSNAVKENRNAVSKLTAND